MISLADALETLHQTDNDGFAIPFSIRFVTANIAQQTGGEERHLQKAVLLRKQPHRINSNETASALRKRKKPNHFQNATLNLLDLQLDRTVKIHIWLITHVNNIPVAYFIHG